MLTLNVREIQNNCILCILSSDVNLVSNYLICKATLIPQNYCHTTSTIDISFTEMKLKPSHLKILQTM